MKRTLCIASIIGLFLITALDLQAHYGRKVLPRSARAGIAVAVASHAPLAIPRGFRAANHFRQGRIAREIRGNERRIWRLERRINRLERYRGGHWEIRELEREIDRLQRRNAYLRSRFY